MFLVFASDLHLCLIKLKTSHLLKKKIDFFKLLTSIDSNLKERKELSWKLSDLQCFDTFSVTLIRNYLFLFTEITPFDLIKKKKKTNLSIRSAFGIVLKPLIRKEITFLDYLYCFMNLPMTIKILLHKCEKEELSLSAFSNFYICLSGLLVISFLECLLIIPI